MKSFLTEVNAKARALSVRSGIKYDLFLNLQKGQKYSGMCDYNFKLADKDTVFLDFTGQNIHSLSLNSNLFKPSEISSIWKNGFLHLPKSELCFGENKLFIEFSNNYYNDGNGLHSFIDTDQNQYIYTQSEPFWTNRIFPIFDQPDLKGRLSLKVQSSDDWTVIGNTVSRFEGSMHKFMDSDLQTDLEVKIASISSQNKESLKNQKFWSFVETPLLPTYLYGFAAGPFSKIQVAPEKKLAGIDMNIYCRSSLVKFANMQTEQLFSYCSEGVKFYNDFFQVEYPFQKFDFVFCPEYTVGAMEYPGIVTFNDRYIFRENATQVQVSHRGETIVHELAHMWFGNLVTMRWWNDLWLNEAFASWVSYLANDRINKNLSFKTIDSWTSFQLQKFRAYNEDQELTTHPIACEVVSTDKADSIFDAITYCKGASALKQLYYLLGHQKFSDNIASYFKSHRWSNSILDDFIGEMSKNTNKLGLPFTLHEWNKMWIETAGLNVVETQWDPKSNGKCQMTFEQTAARAEYPLLRYHKMKVAFFDKTGNIVETQEIMLNNKKNTTIEFENKNFVAVLPNYEDWTFIKIYLDKYSIDFFLNNFEKITCSQSKLLIVRSFYEMVRDAKLRGDVFLRFLFDKFFLCSEIEDILLFDSIMSLAHETVFRYMPKKMRFENCDYVFNKLLEIKSKQTVQAHIQVIDKKMISFAFSENAIEKLRLVFDEQLKLEKASMGFNDRWNIVVKINGSEKYSFEEKQKYFEFMQNIDKSDLMKYSKIVIDYMKADLETRKTTWESIKDEHSTISYGDLEYILSGMFGNLVPEKLKSPFYDMYFELLPEMIKNHSKTYARVFLTGGIPDSDEVQWKINKFEEVLKKIDQNNEFFPIMIKKIIFGLKRKQKVLNLFN